MYMEKIIRAALALSDKTRVRIVSLLLERGCCVCEVMQALNISQTRASRNLRILSDAGFLDLRTCNSYSLYSLKKEKDSLHNHLLEALKNELSGNTTAQNDVNRLQSTKRVKPGLLPQA
jgi:ArsR family transcriptional regulator, arsenate/arsenite/antimonite-responsive transcriptional repressor